MASSDGYQLGRSRVTDSEKKRRRASRVHQRRLSSVYLGNAIVRWQQLLTRLHVDNEELAVALMDYYHEHRNCLRVTASTPGRSGAETCEPVGVSDVSVSASDRSEGEISDVAVLESSTDVIEVTGVLEETQVYGKDSSSSSQFEDASEEDFMDREGEDTPVEDEDDKDDEDYDTDDVTWEPTLESIHLDDDSLLMDDQPEDYPEDVVVDVSFTDPDGLESDEDDFAPSTAKTVRGNYIRLDDPKQAAASEKAIAFESSLLQLANLSPPTTCSVKGCGAPVTPKTSKKGTSMFINWKCTRQQHTVRTWCSQPKLPRGVLAGDFALASCILLSGNNYKKIALMTKFLNLGCVNSASFARIQSLYCCPAISDYWEATLNTNKESLRDKDVVIAGDGRMDSPGFCAKYCTYTVINVDTLDIIDMEILDKRSTDLKSGNMETKGFKDALQNLAKDDINVIEVVTDAHPSISAYMRKEKPTIKHSYDVWHGAKNLSKKLTAISSYKATRELRPWRGDIINHFWHCCQTAEGNEVDLRTKWTSVVHHTANEHDWVLGQCDHGPIEEQDKEYLKPGSPAHNALAEFVFDDRTLRNLKYYVNYRSTSQLEGFQNHILMYAGKRFAYSYPTYKARCELAALDYQLHKDRQLKKTKDGKQIWHRQYNKNSARWSANAQKEEKSYTYIVDILADIFQRRIEDMGSITRRVQILESDPRWIASTIAPVKPPPTEEIVKAKKSRFSST